VNTAHEEFRRAVQITQQAGLNELAAQYGIQDAESHAVVGQCAEARTEVAGALALSRDNFALERASRALAVCGAGAEASSLAGEFARRFPDATLTMRVSVPVTSAAVAIERKNPMRSLELLEPVRPYDHAPVAEFWPSYLRGQAHLQLHEGREAVVDFQSIVDHRGEMPDAVLYPLAHLGLARSAALAGDLAKARKAYEEFFAWWKDADADLRPLEEARAEYARLPGVMHAPEPASTR